MKGITIWATPKEGLIPSLPFMQKCTHTKSEFYFLWPHIAYDTLFTGQVMSDKNNEMGTKFVAPAT